jgi:hypothetical protein
MQRIATESRKAAAKPEDPKPQSPKPQAGRKK